MTGLRQCRELPVTPLPPPKSIFDDTNYRDIDYNRPGAKAFALRNADRVTSLGAFAAPNFAAIRKYSQLQDLTIQLGRDRASIALLPCSLIRLVV